MRMTAPRKEKRSICDVTSQSLRAIVPGRFISARKLSGLNQSEAAERMGFQNSSMLCKIESGAARAELYVITRAALVYAVSSDFLTGLSDFPEKDPATIEQIAVMRHVRKVVTDQAAATMRDMIKIAGDAAPLRAHVRTMARQAGELYREFCKDKAAPTFATSVETLIDSVEAAEQFLKRRDVLNNREYMTDLQQHLEYPLLALIEKQGELEQHEASIKSAESVSES